MTVCSDIINDALEFMGVASVITPPEPEQQTAGFKALRGLIAEWMADDYEIYISLPEEIDDDIGESPDITESIKFLLAERMAAPMQVAFTPEKNKLVRAGKDRIYSLRPDRDTVFGNNIPLGQGNYAPNRRAFFKGKTC